MVRHTVSKIEVDSGDQPHFNSLTVIRYTFTGGLQPSERANWAGRPPRHNNFGRCGSIGGWIKGEGLSLAPFGGGGNHLLPERSDPERSGSGARKFWNFGLRERGENALPGPPFFQFRGSHIPLKTTFLGLILSIFSWLKLPNHR